MIEDAEMDLRVLRDGERHGLVLLLKLLCARLKQLDPSFSEADAWGVLLRAMDTTIADDEFAHLTLSGAQEFISRVLGPCP